ncbi:MAG: hypothetical protein M3Q29_15670 [Chloroflexota bacterium]|nr:hypothetical protein [Chloroflexota bacterium]
MKTLRSLLTALALLALFAVPAFAQNGSVTISVDCGAPEGATITNDTDETLTVEGVNSSEDQVGDPEIDLDLTIEPGDEESADWGSSTGGGNIFENGEAETATFLTSFGDLDVECGTDDAGSETFEFGQPAPTNTPEPANTPTVEETPTLEATNTPTDGKVTNGQDEDEQTEDDQSEDMPEEMPETGVGGLATGLSVGSIAAGLTILMAAGYATLRRLR